MNLVRTSAREAAGALQTRIRSNLSYVQALGSAMQATRSADMPPSREQISLLSKATLSSSEDVIGAAVTG